MSSFFLLEYKKIAQYFFKELIQVDCFETSLPGFYRVLNDDWLLTLRLLI